MRITDLRKKIGKTDLYIEDLKIESGLIHGLVGPNGCGKTTLLKLIMGIVPPDSGTIDYEGLSMTDMTMMSQRPYLMHKSVYDNIVYPLKIRGEHISRDEVEALMERGVEIIMERHREDGSTWLIVSHQWDEMNDLFDKVHHMEKGRIVKNETSHCRYGK